MDTRQKLSAMTIGLHWLIALAIIGMIIMGEVIGDWPRSPFKSQMFALHFSIGMTILVFALWRIVWRMINGFPQPTGPHASWERLLAKITHWALILGTVAMPLSGILTVMARGRGIDIFGLIKIPALMARNESLHQIGEFLHGAGAKVLILAIVLHVLGAAKHQWFDKDGTLARMAGRRVDVA